MDAQELYPLVNGICNEIASVRSAIEELTQAVRELATAGAGDPLRIHLALRPCWCGQTHMMAEAIALNAKPRRNTMDLSDVTIPDEVPAELRPLLQAIQAQLGAMRSLHAFVSSIAEETTEQWEAIAELRDELLAIANRIESTNRVLASRTEHLA